MRAVQRRGGIEKRECDNQKTQQTVHVLTNTVSTPPFQRLAPFKEIAEKTSAVLRQPPMALARQDRSASHYGETWENAAHRATIRPRLVTTTQRPSWRRMASMRPRPGM